MESPTPSVNTPEVTAPSWPLGPTSAPRTSLLGTDALDHSDFTQVFSACLGPSIAVQDAVHDRLLNENLPWLVDFPKGTLSFGTNSYPIQFLGSVASSDNSWMWGWNNVNGFDESLLEAANTVRTLGEQWGLGQLTTPRFILDGPYDGRCIALVATVLSGKRMSWYRGPHTAGEVLLGFTDLPDEVFAPISLARFTHIVADALHAPADHGILVRSLLAWNGTAFDEDGKDLTAHFPERGTSPAQDLRLEFDTEGRLHTMTTI